MTDVATYALTQIVLFVLMFGGIWALASWFYKTSSMRVSIMQTRYIDLYELYKVNEELEARGLSFKQLDKFELDLIGHKKTAIQRIDDKYKKEKAELKKGK